MFILYDLIFLIVAVVYLPLYLLKRKLHRGCLLRLGLLPKDLWLDNPLWVHAVSVGEATAIRGLISELKVVYPHKKFVISTVTPTGNKIAKSIAAENDFVTYLPFDFSFIVRRVIDTVNPCCFIIAETEIWPNLISYLNKKNIPVVIVNGRISDSSFRGYKAIKFLLKAVLNKINLFCVQTQSDALRLSHLGVSNDKIHVTGNMKFDNIDYADKIITEGLDKSRVLLNLGVKEKLWVAGSTHPGEEKIILAVYKSMLKEFPELRLLIAPRHPERSAQVERLIAAEGFAVFRISKLEEGASLGSKAGTVFILDTVGRLLSFYAIASIVFVGGSLIKKGGHNILEPAALGKPIMFGPYMFNFRDIADLFLKFQAAVLVSGAVELEGKLRYLLNNPGKAEDFSRRAREVTQEQRGATQKNLQYLKKLL